MLGAQKPGIQAKMHALFGDCADSEQAVYDYPGNLGENNDQWGFEIDKMQVKMQKGPDMEVETFPYVMAHLLKYKGKGPCGDIYRHYQVMPPCFV